MPYEKVGAETRCLVDEIPFDIPDSWEWVRLGSISTYADTKQKVNAQYADKDMWGLDLEDIEKGGRLVDHKTVGERKAIGDKTCFSKGDILYSKLRPYLLKILIAPECGICTPEIVPFRMYGEIDTEYIVNFLKSPYVDNLINSITYGVKMPRVGTETMLSLLVPLPPLYEQKRIVAKINEVMPEVSAYEEAHDKAEMLNAAFPDALKKSILQQAIQGKLVPQDPNDEPAAVLLERIREEKEQLIKAGKIKRDKHESVIFRRDNSHYEKRGSEENCIDEEIPFDIPDSWAWCRLSTVLEKLTDGTHSTPKYTDCGIPFISVKDVSSGVLSFDSVKYISEIEHRELYKRCDPKRGDILLTKVGTTGIPVIVDTDKEFSLFVSVAQLRFSHSLLDSDYLLLLIKSPLVQKQCTEHTRGVGNKNWVMRDIANTLIVLPPLAEQKRIVSFFTTMLPLIRAIGSV